MIRKILLAFMLLPTFIWSQGPEMSQLSRQDLKLIKDKTPYILKGNQEYFDKLPLTLINDEVYVSFLGKIKDEVGEVESVENVIIGKGYGKIRSVRIKVTDLEKIDELTQFSYLEVASKIRAQLDKANYDTRADSVHLGIHLPQPYTGKDVIIGVNDWGFDYTSPMFYDTLLQHSRILAAWDQWKRSGPHPDDFGYGTEYNSWEELSVAQSDTSNQYGYGTHATHVAGIAGGSGAGVIAKGIAFESEFLFTTIFVDEAAAIDSWYWMYEKSLEYGKNLVVNMSWGLYNMGTSDGTSLLSQAIDELSDFGVLFVSSAGNNGGVNFHFKKQFDNDSVVTIVEFENYNNYDSLWGQSIHGWGEIGQNFEFKIEILYQSGSFLDETPYFSTTLNGYDEGFIAAENYDTIWYNVAAEEAHPQSLKPNIRFIVKNTNTNLTVQLRVKAEAGLVHCWNIAHLTTNGGNWGLPFKKKNSSYIGGDTEYGIGEPTSANSCISVASHIPEALNAGGVLTGGNRSSFSSIGPRNDEVIKPDISGPGQNILSSISSFNDENIPVGNTIEFNGRTYGFARLSGTSMSSPTVAGVCALVWETNPYLTPHQIKEIIIESARLDDKTGMLPIEGDVQWGHGKVDAMRATQLALGVLGLNEINPSSVQWEVYPNPTSENIRIKGLNDIETVELYDINGKKSILDHTKEEWNISGYSAGIYIFRVVANKRVYQKKIVVQ